MTEIDNGEPLSNYFGWLFGTWFVFIVVAVVIYRYVWPVMVALYWEAAKRLFWFFRDFREETRKGRRNRK